MSERRSVGPLLQAALNGDRVHPAAPRTPGDIASEACAAVDAGARSLHLHPYDEDGRQTFAAEPCAATLRAVRAACPGIPISLSTSADVEPDPRKRIALVEAWAELPDLVTANQGEDGIVELCELLVNRGIGIEAGLLALDDAHRFVAVGVASRCVRAMVEPLDADAGDAIAHAEAIEKVLIDAGITLEQVHHGDGIPTAGAKYFRTVFRSRFRLCAICTCERPASQCTNNSTRSTTSKLLLAIGRSLSHRVGEQQRRHRKRPNPAPPRPSSPWGIT